MKRIADGIAKRFLQDSKDRERASELLVEKSGGNFLWFRLGACDRLESVWELREEVTLQTVEDLGAGLESAFEGAFTRLGHGGQTGERKHALRSPFDESRQDEDEEHRQKRLSEWALQRRWELTYRLFVLLSLRESIREKDLPRFVRAPAATVAEVFRTLSVFFAADADGFIQAAHKSVFDWALDTHQIERNFADRDRGDVSVIEAVRHSLERQKLRTEGGREGGSASRKETEDLLLEYSFKHASTHLERINDRVGKRHLRKQEQDEQDCPLRTETVPSVYDEIRKWGDLLLWPRVWGFIGFSEDKKIESNELLCLAARFGQVDAVKGLLAQIKPRGTNCLGLRQQRADEQASVRNSSQALHFAAFNGHIDVVSILLDRGFAVDVKDEDGETPLYGTPLYWASLRGHADVVTLLLDKGASVDARDQDGETPLHRAAVKGHLQVASLLLQRGAAVDARSNDRVTPLILAASRGFTEMMKLLLDSGAAVNATAEAEQMPLHSAASYGQTAAVAMLLERGAAIDARAHHDCPAVHGAAIFGYTDVTALLIDRGAGVNAVDSNLMTPLHHAAVTGYAQVAMLLLDKGGAAVDAKDRWCVTPLVRATANGHTELAAILLDRGAQVDAENVRGETSLYVATARNDKKLVTLLLERGAAVDAKDREGRTPLHSASIKGYTELAGLLRAKGADTNVTDIEGKTPGDYASARQHSNQSEGELYAVWEGVCEELWQERAEVV